MIRLTIIKEDNLVGIDGKFTIIDCSSLPIELYALQWDAVNSVGEIEWYGSPKPPNTKIYDILAYQDLVTEWYKANPIPVQEPAANSSQISVLIEPVLRDGKWYQNWIVRDRTSEEVEERRSILSQLITSYRDRKIAEGFEFDGVMYDSRPEDQKRISGASLLAYMAVANGAQPGDYYWHGGIDPFEWIAQDNTTVQMDAFTVIEFGKKAAEHEKRYIFAARNLKDMDVIPDDYEDPSYWP
jgi:hypothetical protein